MPCGIIGTPLVDTHAKFIKTASYGDTLQIHVHVAEWRGKSFVQRYRITRGADDQVRVGTDGWLYLTDEVKYEPRAADNMALRVGTVAKTAEALKAQGVQLLVAVVPDKVRMAYRLSLDEWNGRQRVQMVVEAAE